MNKRQPLRVKDIENTYRDHRNVDFRFEGRRRRHSIGRLTLSGVVGGLIGFLLWYKAPQGWGVESRFYLFPFVIVGDMVGTAVGHFFSSACRRDM